MRWVAVLTIALLLASVQCLSACTLASCTEHAQQDAQAPPCHSHHHKAPAPDAGHPCDHQNAVKAPSTDLTPTHWALAPFELATLALIVASPVTASAHLHLESPPGLLAPSVLRI
jgi:hypothetical protein